LQDQIPMKQAGIRCKECGILLLTAEGVVPGAGMSEWKGTEGGLSRMPAHDRSLSPSSNGNGSTHSVLIIDDELTFVAVMGEVLESFGFQVHQAYSVGQALTVLESVTPDLILTDLRMPDSDGIKLLEQLRSEPAWGHIPKIVITAKASTNDLSEARKAGADGFLRKPFSVRELRAAIKPFLPIIAS
jgi:CheY-like chemotaxis protein